MLVLSLFVFLLWYKEGILGNTNCNDLPIFIRFLIIINSIMRLKIFLGNV